MALVDYRLLFEREVEGIYGSFILRDMADIIKLYDLYDNGVKAEVENGLDFKPTQKTTNIIKRLIKEEARFLFGKTPELKIVGDKTHKEALDTLQTYLDGVLDKNMFSDKLVKAARDCFIGRRVALKLHASKENGIKIMFVPSLEFVFETKPDDVDELQKIIFFYAMNTEQARDKQRIWKQKYEMKGGHCLLSEGLYNGLGELLESYKEDYDTMLSGIPAYVIFNDGLSGDLRGESDVEELLSNQEQYNRIASGDIDALVKGMYQITYGIDVEGESIKAMRNAAGAFWDVQTEPTGSEAGRQAKLGTITNDFGYDGRIENSLNRMQNEMYATLNIPNISPDQLKGYITSGKAMKALYWQLVTRCEEKFASWRPALQWMVKAILEMTQIYHIMALPFDTEYSVQVDNQYPLMEDEDTEKALDLQEVNAQVMSRKSYMRKWYGYDDENAETELAQIAKERQLLEESYLSGMAEDDDNDPTEE